MPISNQPKYVLTDVISTYNELEYIFKIMYFQREIEESMIYNAYSF